MNSELIEKINALSYEFVKNGLNAEFEIVVDTDTFYKIVSAYSIQRRPWEIGDATELSLPKEFNTFTVNSPGGKITIVPKQRTYYKEYNEDDKYPF